jgi:hypothetical protein
METGRILSRLIRCLVLSGSAWLWLSGAAVRAHETDNFFMPLHSDLADLGDFLEVVHTKTLEEAVAEVNAGIERALEIRNHDRRTERLARWHDPDAVARAFQKRFSAVSLETRVAEHAVGGSWARRSYPGQITRHYGIWLNFSAHFILDPRILVMLSQAATLKAYGVYFGADKLTHFHHLGWSYFAMYRGLLAKGLSPEEAYRRTLEHHVGGGVLAEKNLFGTIGTGVYSNADMAANHSGFKFFLNLSEPVRVQGVLRDPLVVRCGVFWRLNQHVRIHSGWFRPFISDHWNEALNPSLYDWTMRAGVRRVLRSRAEAIIGFYAGKDGRPKDPVYFDNLAQDLATYYGEAYGHSGHFDKIMTIGNTCFPALQPEGPSSK